VELGEEARELWAGRGLAIIVSDVGCDYYIKQKAWNQEELIKVVKSSLRNWEQLTKRIPLKWFDGFLFSFTLPVKGEIASIFLLLALELNLK